MSFVDRVKSGVSGAYHATRDAARHVVDTGRDVVHHAVDAGSDAAHEVVEAGGHAVHEAADAGSHIVRGAARAGGDVVELSSEAAGTVARGVGGAAGDAAGAVREQAGNYAGGVYQWGRNQVSTTWDAVSHPTQSWRGADSLARFNPVYGIPAAALEGKNPAEWLGDNYRFGTGVRDGYVEEYRNVRDEHGYAGVAGYIAPEAVIAALSGGTGTAGESATRQAARVGVDTATPGVRDAYTRSGPAADDDKRWWQGGIDLLG